MKLIEVHRVSVCSSDRAKIREIRILPNIIIALRADREGSRLKFWHFSIEWLEWYVNIRNPWYKRQEPAKHTHQGKDPPWLAKAMKEETGG